MALPISYNIRNVRVRWQVTLLAIVGIAMVVAVFAVLLSMSAGFQMALRSTGRPDNAIIVQRGSASELTSGVPIDHRNIIVVDDRVARGPDGQPLAAWDWVVVVSLPKTDRRAAHQRHPPRGHPPGLRGARRHPGDRRSEVHPRPRRGDRGPQDHRPHPGHARRGDGEVQQKRFQIVGLFESQGGAFESEIWGDYDALGAIFQRGAGSNSLVVRMKNPADIPDLDRFDPGPAADAAPGALRAEVLRRPGRPPGLDPAQPGQLRGLHHGGGRGFRGHEHDVRHRGRAHA